MTKKELILKQIEMQEKIQKLADINIVTCGNCDSIVLHERKHDEIVCPYCFREMAVSDCQDYLYDGMENKEVY